MPEQSKVPEKSSSSPTVYFVFMAGSYIPSNGKSKKVCPYCGASFTRSYIDNGAVTTYTKNFCGCQK